MVKEIIYQILPRLWGPARGENRKGGSLAQNGCGTFADIDTRTLDYLASLGVTAVWYTGVIRHATRCRTNGCKPSSAAFVKGRAGSPYCVTDWFDVNPYLAQDPAQRMQEFSRLVRRTHRAGMKVLLDFVPNHVSRDYGAFSPRPLRDGRDALGHPVLGACDDPTVHWKPENDFYYYPGEPLRLPVPGNWQEMPAKASGNCFGPAPGLTDWYDTIRLNYCDFHTPTWDKMREVVLFWAGKGVDGVRCDMVEMVPPAFFAWLIPQVKAEYPDFLFIAEVYEKSRYQQFAAAGFDALYDKSGRYDALFDIVVHGGSARQLTWNWQSLGSLQSRMLHFLENHDEVRLASDAFAGSARRGMAALYASLLFDTAPFLLYFGQEAGERGMDEEGFSGRNGRTTIFDWWSPATPRRIWQYIHGKGALLPEEQAALGRYMELLNLARRPLIRQGGTYDLCYCCREVDGFDPDRHFVFLRGDGKDLLLVACNFSDSPAEWTVTIPAEALRMLGFSGEGMRQTVSVAPQDGTVLSLFCGTLPR